MPIKRVIVKNYRALKHADVSFKDDVNIVVGDNECGKSTLLEAINLALKCQLNRRPAQYELHPFLINAEAVASFVAAHKAKRPTAPPEASIEVFLADRPEIAALRGTNNSLKLDCPGLSLSIRLDEACQSQFEAYVGDPTVLNSIPIEYYEVQWMDFSGKQLSPRAPQIKSVLIDPSNAPNAHTANKYVLEIVKDYLTKSQSGQLALAFRTMKDRFQDEPRIQALNEELAQKRGVLSDKTLTLSMDTTTRASWESGTIPHLDAIPLTLVGKGEQNAIKIKMAVEASEKCDVFLVEEPENHLSHTNLGRLVGHLSKRCEGRQLIISTHSSFVLNKLGIDHVLMFNGSKAITLDSLPSDTKRYFQRLPGHATLRMILACRTILVEGPSDELIVQLAYEKLHRKPPLQDGVEVISVGTSFKRFLDIARLLSLKVDVVRDNDGDVDRVRALYEAYAGIASVRIHIDDDNAARTLEPQLLKFNGLANMNTMLGKSFVDEAELIDWCTKNKTECALALCEFRGDVKIPKYVQDAVR